MAKTRLRFVGVRASDGKRVYVKAGKGCGVLAYAIYAHTNGRLQLVGRIEDRPHKNERIWRDRVWVPAERELTPREVAEQKVIWWTEIGKTVAEAVRLWPTKKGSPPAGASGVLTP